MTPDLDQSGSHQVYADYMEIDGANYGYAGACHTCGWRADTIHKSKLRARDDAQAHANDAAGWTLDKGLEAAEIAKSFHDFYESLAPKFAYQTRKQSAVPWADVPLKNKQLMIATVVALIQGGFIEPGPKASDPDA